MKRWKLWTATLALARTGAALGAAAQTLVKLKAGMVTGIDQVGLPIALERGFFEKHGLDVTIARPYATGVDALNALQAGVEIRVHEIAARLKLALQFGQRRGDAGEVFWRAALGGEPAGLHFERRAQFEDIEDVLEGGHLLRRHLERHRRTSRGDERTAASAACSPSPRRAGPLPPRAPRCG